MKGDEKYENDDEKYENKEHKYSLIIPDCLIGI